MNRRHAGALALVLVVIVAALGLLHVAAPADEALPRREPPPVAPGERAPPAPPAADATAPGPRGDTPALPVSATAEAHAGARPPVPAGRVRLSGRLVAARLEWGWVQALPLHPEEEELATDEDEEGERPPATTVDAEGVPTVTPRRADDPEGAALGRPGGGWAVPAGATRVDRAGAFALDLAPGTWLVLAGARGCRTRVETLALTAGQEVTWPLELDAPATLTLTCLAAGGEPLAHGRVECLLLRDAAPAAVVLVGDGPWGSHDVEELAEPGDQLDQRTLELDADGRARLELPAGAVQLVATDRGERLRVESEGWAAVDGPLRWTSPIELPGVRVTLAAGERRDLTLRQAAATGGALAVRVFDAAGSPVAGAQVGLTDTDDGPVYELLDRDDGATTGADGRARFLEVGLGAWFVAARKDGRAGRSAVRALRAPGEVVELELVLDEAEDVGGFLVRAVDAETGAPLARVRLNEPPPPGEGLTFYETRRVGPGLWRADQVPLGHHRVSVVAAGRAARVVEVDVAAGPPRQVDVPLAPAAVVTGRIAGSIGRETVWLVQRAAPGNPIRVLGVDGTGAFRFDEGAAAGDELLLRVFPPDSFEHQVAVQAPADVVVTLPATRWELRAVGPDGAPAQVSVYVQDASESELLQAMTDDAGRLVLRGDPPGGPAGVTVSAGGALPVPLAPEVVIQVPAEEPAPDREPEEAPRVDLRGTVLDPAGRPVAGAQVESDDADGRQFTTTRPDGTFDLEVLVAPVELLVRRPDLGGWAERVDVGPKGASVTLRFRPTVAVRVRAPAQVIAVTFTPDGGWCSERLQGSIGFRRADGTFDLGLLLPGAWTLTRYGEGWEERGAQTIQVAPPGPLVVTLE